MRRVALLLLLLAGCSAGRTDDPGEEAGPLTVEAYQLRMSRAACVVLSCGFGLPPSTCAAIGATTTNEGKAVAAGRATFDPEKAAACLAQVEAATQGSCWGESATIPAASDQGCEGVLTGLVEAGADCYSSAECAGGGACAFPDSTCPGKCQARVAAGASCESDTNCQAGLHCGPDGKCAAPAEAGGECFLDSACASGLECLDGRCGVRPTVGAGGTCVEDADCSSGYYCVKGATETGSCAARVAAGQACTQAGSAFFGLISTSECKGHQVCVGLSQTLSEGVVAGRCGVPADVGGACQPAAAEAVFAVSGCFVGLVCDPVTSRCKAAPTAGQACGPRGECANATCDDDGFCVARKKPGAECSSSRECEHRCDLETKRCVAAFECLAP